MSTTVVKKKEKAPKTVTLSESDAERSKRRKKRYVVTSVIAGLILLFILFALFTERIFGEDAWITQIVQENILGVLNIFGAIADNVETVFRALSSLVIIFIIYKLIYFTMKLLVVRGCTKRRRTIVEMILNFAKYIAIIAALISILGVFGVNVGAMLAGLGILGLIIGLGAQSLISDIIAGLFIIMEGSFQVGDIITFQGYRGEVVHIGLRTTKILAVDGNVQIINNSEIRVVINMTQKGSIALCDITIEYGENLAKVEKIVRDNLESMGKNLTKATADPSYLGPADFSERGVVLRFICDCEEANRMPLTRELNRELKMLFDKHKIKVAVPVISVETKR